MEKILSNFENVAVMMIKYINCALKSILMSSFVIFTYIGYTSLLIIYAYLAKKF